MMRCFKKLHIYSLLTFMALTALTSCKKEEVGSLDTLLPPVPTNSLLTVLKADPQFSTFVKGLERTHLDLTLVGRFPGTIFAPTNTAFDKTTINVTTMSVDDLTPLLRYHLVLDKKMSSEFVGKDALLKSNFPAGDGNRLFFTTNTAGTIINGIAMVAQKDKAAENGIIHTLDRVLRPPVGNILKALQSDSANFIYLTTALAVVDTSKDKSTTDEFAYKIIQKLGGDSTTFFAPNNTALINALGLPSGGDAVNVKAAKAKIVATNPEELNKILTYHIVKPRIFNFSSVITGGQLNVLPAKKLLPPLPPLPDRIVTINKMAIGFTITDAKGGTANVTDYDRITYNGVIHTIDKVLMP